MRPPGRPSLHVLPMSRLVRAAWTFADNLLARATVAAGIEAPGVISLLFHAVGERQAAGVGPLDPTVSVTLDGLDGCIRHFLEAGYRFVDPESVDAGLDPSGRWVLLTFDDGYFNNVSVLPVLEHHRVPAVFFISTKHVATGAAFWWDALYRARARQGVALPDIQAEQNALKHLHADAIEGAVLERLGSGALDPEGDADRPMTPDELRRFAASPWVRLGNHTHDHAILANYDRAGATAQLRRCQEWLEAEIGASPIIVAYPNGDVAADTVAAAADCGLRLGLTTVPRRISLPLPPGAERLLMPRFSLRDGLDTPDTYVRFRAHPTLLQQMAQRLRRATP